MSKGKIDWNRIGLDLYKIGPEFYPKIMSFSKENYLCKVSKCISAFSSLFLNISQKIIIIKYVLIYPWKSIYAKFVLKSPSRLYKKMRLDVDLEPDTARKLDEYIYQFLTFFCRWLAWFLCSLSWSRSCPSASRLTRTCGCPWYITLQCKLHTIQLHGR